MYWERIRTENMEGWDDSFQGSDEMSYELIQIECMHLIVHATLIGLSQEQVEQLIKTEITAYFPKKE